MRSVIAFGSVLFTVAVFSMPAAADAKKPVDFVTATCLNTIDDLAKVDAIAKQNNWKAVVEKGQRPDLQIRSQWDALLDGQHFLVMTATGNVQGLGPANVCMVMFPRPDVMAPEFVKEFSRSVQLKTLAEMKIPGGRMDMHMIEGRAQRTMLQLMSKEDGGLIFVSIIGAQ